MFMGIGYSVVSSNLMFNGNIELSKYESPYLYDVLRFENIRGGLASKYTGEHHDSFVEEPSKDIYYWDPQTDEEGSQILNKNNVIFADHCWQMIRTTDTGGVKMIYNGEVENGQCLNTRGNHFGYNSTTSETMSSSYWYGTDYIYDKSSGLFSISGVTEQATWNSTTGPGLVGKYTCKSANESGTCSILYYIEDYNSSSKANAINITTNSHYSQLGKLKYNDSASSPAHVGYMYGDNYTATAFNKSSLSFHSGDGIVSSRAINNSYWFADSYSYDSSTDKYTLNNAYQVSPSDLSSLVGKYSIYKTTSSDVYGLVYYIVAVDSTKYYAIQMADGNSLSYYEPIQIGDSITDNANGTYTVNNTVSVTALDWYSNYANYNNKYTCVREGITCAEPRYIIKTEVDAFSYVYASRQILLGKGFDGTYLTDTLLLNHDELFKDISIIDEYKFTCGSTNDSCSEAQLTIFTGGSSVPGSLNTIKNYYYGSDITWDGTNYTLTNPIGGENYNNYDNLATHHYVCETAGTAVCRTVKYIFFVNSTVNYYYSFIRLTNGDTLEDVFSNMFESNNSNTLIKTAIDEWYRKNLLEYDDMIEDTIFCNERSIKDLGGWNPNGGLVLDTKLKYKGNSITKDLSCTNNTDKFSINNPSAQLTYKVGLVSSPEMRLLNNALLRTSGELFWTITPNSSPAASLIIINASGEIKYASGANSYGVRPSISLKPGTEYIYGNGSMEDPYVVKPVKECTYNGELTQGAEFVDGQYTYRYMQEWNYDSNIGNQNWVNITDDGWGVRLTNLNVNTPVNSRLCTSINNKPIVSMNNMFLNSQAQTIDISSFDTSNVKNMSGMFAGSAATNLDLRSFDTSKVTNMNNMFSGSLATSIDVSSFDTKNVTNMSGMFSWSNSTSLNLSSFNTSKVTDMTFMFGGSQATSLDLSSFDNRHNVDTDGMFCTYDINNVITGNNFTINSDMTECGSA